VGARRPVRGQAEMDASLTPREAPRGAVNRAIGSLGAQIGILRRRSLFRGYQVAYATTFAIIGAQIIAAYFIGRSVFDTGFRDVIGMGASARMWAGWLFLPLAFVGLVTLKIVRRRSERPTVLLLRWLRFRADWLIRGFLIVAAYPAMAKSFTVIKAAIPKLVGFWADPVPLPSPSYSDRCCSGGTIWLTGSSPSSEPR